MLVGIDVTRIHFKERFDALAFYDCIVDLAQDFLQVRNSFVGDDTRCCQGSLKTGGPQQTPLLDTSSFQWLGQIPSMTLNPFENIRHPP